MNDETKVKRYVFTKQEVADILARYIEVSQQNYLHNPRLEIGTHDILLVSAIVD